MENLSIYFALSAGLLSFFSPCVFPLIPAYVAHLSDGTVSSGKVNTNKRVLLLRSISFILGFSIVFVLLGASASFVGQLFLENKKLIQMFGGILIIIFGIQILGIFKIKFLMSEKRFIHNSSSKANSIRSFILGLAFGSGWTPCVGLALSSILLLASSTETVFSGMLLLWIYSLGLGIPFLLLSIIVTYSLNVVKKINKILPKLSLINGWVLILMGILLFTGQMQKISSYLSTFTF
ncbi:MULTISPECIES: cytochrome c biogenesis CcdA family protein [Cytobacillus]|uniref:cytochrome c biogenesis CcdA family protein n=1 Tax=Cytobacillus TaxID=2675230 RepID=UPI00077CCDB3|nr:MULTISPECIES: cytochrome c biogenesis protein CcdA [Cytobacillus]KAF0815708.1 Cytochrome c-type biogenesis protein CcdA [Bacillus sp. ZZV12-4809]MBG9541519.1 cytochrome C biogenesis protein DsbD [Cytobacillus firmus]MBG9546110.1 cytochrome C biogenesis protein DsbD [Cytobacillus firmus]MBG9551453.1 cytochrome C biogenesis protein DsbD [Cytobacillus firmus]MBG9556744.1 cytochrome C biogenesis protein DsbD [Cytobacillus firmus]